MFDVNAVGVANLDRRVTSHYNAKAEFYTNYYKADAGYYNDLNENFVVFFIETRYYIDTTGKNFVVLHWLVNCRESAGLIPCLLH